MVNHFYPLIIIYLMTDKQQEEVYTLLTSSGQQTNKNKRHTIARLIDTKKKKTTHMEDHPSTVVHPHKEKQYVHTCIERQTKQGQQTHTQYSHRIKQKN